MPKPIAHSNGVFQKETMMRKRQASTKLIGSTIFTYEKKGGLLTRGNKETSSIAPLLSYMDPSHYI